jgi:glycosyltransferase involved in cell wall biosynthesis
VEALDNDVLAGKGMNTSGEHLPTGFQGPVRAWSSLVPMAERTLQLPRDRALLREFRAQKEAVASPTFDLVEVQAITESLGRIEDALQDCASRLTTGGTLLLDVDNVQSLRMLRIVIEGRPGCFDAAGSTDDPTQALALKRVLAATVSAGLLVTDVIRVPSAATEIGADFARDVFERGMLPLDWLSGPPPARFWLACTKVQALAGSVLIAGGDVAARERTATLVREFLPVDWEVVLGQGVRECGQWNRAIADARGDLIWFLRAGCMPTRELFEALSIQAGIGATVPGTDDVRGNPGDLSGMMLPRLDVLLAGPLPEHFGNTQIALEEHNMRLDAKLPTAQVVEARFESPGAPAEAPEVFAAETKSLMERWFPVMGDAASEGAVASSGLAVAVGEQKEHVAPWAGRSPRISLCMIARNEEHFLPGCLERARAVADEIIVVDTGSTDRTVQIAESFGAKVIHSPWQDDFSAPRNLGLRHATGDWILVLDADEFLQPGSCERIRELVENPATNGYHLRFVNIYGKGRTLGVMMVRLFRNLPGIEYQNIIHEQVTPSLQRLGAEQGLVLATTDVEVEHYGYTEAVMDQRGKTERNERLFKKQLAQDPDDIYSHYKYGDFLRRVPGRDADARRLLDRCMELILQGSPNLPRELPYAAEVAALCALEAARAGDHGKAREVLDVALRRFMPTPNLHYLSASLALSEGRADDAIAHYRRCLAYRGQVLVVPIQEGITSYVSLAGIAQAWLLRGAVDRAQRLLEQAIAIEPSYEVAQLALSRIWLQRGDAARALRVLTTFLSAHPDSPGACQQTTLILHRLGQTAQAKRMGKHAVSLLEARALDREAAAMNKILATI